MQNGKAEEWEGSVGNRQKLEVIMGHREPTVETKDLPALENYVGDDVPSASVLWTLGKDMNK